MFNYILHLTPIFNDAAEPFQIGFQDGASPGFSGIVALHDSIFFYLVLISIGVF
jgi:cytochrome c oxidase subunit 2